MKEKLKTHIALGRFFAAPIVILAVILGAILAGAPAWLTVLAAKMLGRKCILIDCVKEYCIMARHKLSKVDYHPELEISC